MFHTMANQQELKAMLTGGALDERLRRVYVTDAEIKAQYARYTAVIDAFSELFSGARDIRLFSAPGRTEVGGNHTDHNHGRVLAAGINLDAIAAAAKKRGQCCAREKRGLPDGCGGFVRFVGTTVGTRPFPGACARRVPRLFELRL